MQSNTVPMKQSTTLKTEKSGIGNIKANTTTEIMKMIIIMKRSRSGMKRTKVVKKLTVSFHDRDLIL
jgi:hypothetical protein